MSRGTLPITQYMPSLQNPLFHHSIIPLFQL